MQQMNGFMELAHRMHCLDSVLAAVSLRNGFHADGDEFKRFITSLQEDT